jgi:hypothetical protein
MHAAAESNVRSVKHPFGNGKLPVRGKSQADMMVIASTAMTNIWRIHGRQKKLREEKDRSRSKPIERGGQKCLCLFWAMASVSITIPA